MELDRLAMVSEVLEAVGSEKRLAAFEQVTQGTPVKDIPDEVGASRSGVQHFVSDFEDVGLASSPEDGRYEVTEKGACVADALEELDAEFRRFEVEQLRGMAAESSLSAEEIEEILEDVKEEKSG